MCALMKVFWPSLAQRELRSREFTATPLPDLSKLPIVAFARGATGEVSASHRPTSRTWHATFPPPPSAGLSRCIPVYPGASRCHPSASRCNPVHGRTLLFSFFIICFHCHFFIFIFHPLFLFLFSSLTFRFLFLFPIFFFGYFHMHLSLCFPLMFLFTCIHCPNPI